MQNSIQLTAGPTVIIVQIRYGFFIVHTVNLMHNKCIAWHHITNIQRHHQFKFTGSTRYSIMLIFTTIGVATSSGALQRDSESDIEFVIT